MKTNKTLGRFLYRNITPISLYLGVIIVTIVIPVLIKGNFISSQLAFIALSTTLFLGYLNYQHTQDRLFKDLFKEFNERYNTFSDHYQSLEVKYSIDAKLTDIDDEDIKKVISYLNLCAEEYFWFDKGRIDIGAWDSWKSGMETWARLPVVKVVFEDEVANWTTAYYKGFNTFFRSLIKTG